MPKNNLIEKALRIYLDRLTKSGFRKSYQKMRDDVSVIELAEIGMEDYFRPLDFK